MLSDLTKQTRIADPGKDTRAKLDTLKGEQESYVKGVRSRLEKELAAAQKELDTTAGKLGNEQFLANAPAPVVEKIKVRQKVAQEEFERVTARLEQLPEA